MRVSAVLPFPKSWRYHVVVKAVILFLSLCLPAFADLAAGQQARKNGDYSTALKEFLPLARQGNADAQFNLGNMYQNGEGVPQDDKEAARWYRLAAEQEDAGVAAAIAQLNLGIMYHEGLGVPQDDKEAARWYRLAAEGGLTFAQANLGIMYHEGLGVPQDYKEAARWFRSAAEQNAQLKFKGEAVAQLGLGVMYRQGQGVPQDYKEAVRWFLWRRSRGTRLRRSTLAACITKAKVSRRTTRRLCGGTAWQRSRGTRLRRLTSGTCIKKAKVSRWTTRRP